MVEAAGVEPFVPLILRNLQILQYAKRHKKARMPVCWYKFGTKGLVRAFESHCSKDGKEHTYWSLVESVHTADGPRQRTVCHLGEFNALDHARWVQTVEISNGKEGRQTETVRVQLDAPAGDPQVVRVSSTAGRKRQFGASIWGWSCGSD